MNYCQKSAFTLSEVLIALVVIGIIAAITMPTIISNVEERERTAKVKKVYATLSNALTRVKADGGDLDYNIINDNNENMQSWYDTYLNKYLITTKVCYNTTAGCWNTGNTKQLNGNIVAYNRTGVGVGNGIITAILNDGTFINMDGYNPGDIVNRFGVTTNSVGLVLFFDINGNKKPNTVGKDIFVTVFTENGFVPAWKNKTREEIDADCSSSGTGYSCIQKYLNK
jgi:prepilin-type N-terminal cleavage/methylation domain-containing protein